jgi:hypothetical protein
MDKVDGNGGGGGGGWRMGLSIVDGCNGRGGTSGWLVGVATEDAWDMKYGGGMVGAIGDKTP